MKRRKFLQLGSASLASLPILLHRPHLFAGGLPASPIACAIDRMATSMQIAPGSAPNADGVIVDKVLRFSLEYERVADMVNRALLNLTGKNDPGKAWESLFPQGMLHIGTRIGVKVNFSIGWMDAENDWNKIMCPYGPKSAITEVVINGLGRMLGGTFPVENITIYDLDLAITPGKANPVVQGFRPNGLDIAADGLDRQAGVYSLHWVDRRNPLTAPDDAPGFIAAPGHSGEYSAPQRMIRPVYENDVMINIGNAKDHRAAGVTGAMKNTFGCTDNCVATHGDSWMDLDTPYAGCGLTVPVFYQSIDRRCPTILNILDALAGVYDGGPTTGRIFHGHAIALSRDPVALDTYLMHMINKARAEHGYAELSTADGRAADGHPNASCLRIAEEMQLGSGSMQLLAEMDLSGGKPTGYVPSLEQGRAEPGTPRMQGGEYRLPVLFDRSGRRHRLEARVLDRRGRIVRHCSVPATRMERAELSWNLRDDQGRRVPGGRYVWEIEAEGARYTRTIDA
jgi:hypothetical protein